MLAGSSVREAASSLSLRYRAGNPGGAGYIASDSDAAAYAAARMPATYAAVHRVLAEATARIPGFQPQRLLDAGAGPGTATWAALAVWPGLRAVTLLEKDAHMAALGQSLAARSSSPPCVAANGCGPI